ncbi:cytochrome P450 regulator Dap1 [Schizosaccharomyces japonicus yFS275]|uniref:Cytochrome P450 regulator Dap1 n=1 Tax=Schizosaccharomyces japonicus (strain yFS275 / FY16936) TaxID=402676 RepID=B6K303_SCHJY|nr:cytochrome P450 regulator Dap1 [Schizosaccharomyces japonicus yFS275]EEB07860.2 cytochrome P450 regulator Dap1 [Schizosaccharomyces japonicus yFS275]
MVSPQFVFIVTLAAYIFFTRWRRMKQKPLEPAPELEQPKWSLYTASELKRFNGKSSPFIFLAIKGDVYNVTEGGKFYGPGGPYYTFAGHDASRGLAKSSFEEDVVPEGDEMDDLSDLNEEEKSTLNDWKTFFDQKYPVVGRLVTPTEKEQHLAAEKAAPVENISEGIPAADSRSSTPSEKN